MHSNLIFFFPALSFLPDKFICFSERSLIDCYTRWFNPFPSMLSVLVLSGLDFNGVMINPSPTGLSAAPRQRLNSLPMMHLSHTFPKIFYFFFTAVQISASIHPSSVVGLSAAPACITRLGQI